jgi:hypothetical protein
MQNKYATRQEANKALAEKKKQHSNGNPELINIYKFVGKRKYKFFVGNWWEWLAQIS